MFTWLRNKLRNWLLEAGEEKPPKLTLDCLENNKPATYLITGTVGLYLIAQGRGLVGEGIAVDREHYHQIWRHFNRHVKLEWVGDIPPNEKS